MGAVAWVAAGGALGSLARYGLGLAAAAHVPGNAPAGTFIVNAAGSFFIGLLFGLTENATGFPHGVHLGLSTGFLGGFTTFSAFQWETLKLVKSGEPGGAVMYATGSVILGLALVAAGYGAGRYFAALIRGRG